LKNNAIRILRRKVTCFNRRMRECIMKIRLLFRIRYVTVNLLNGRGWTKLSSRRRLKVASLPHYIHFPSISSSFDIATRYFFPKSNLRNFNILISYYICEDQSTCYIRHIRLTQNIYIYVNDFREFPNITEKISHLYSGSWI